MVTVPGKVKTMPKRLAAFDFDHTILNDNSDTVAISLLDAQVIPDSVQQLFKKDGWTAYMQAIFELLHKHDISKSKITKIIAEIPPVSGMCELITELSENLNFDLIIISDSNSYFIKTWLEKFKLIEYFKQVFTNPGQFENGLLKIEMFHFQDTCKLSTKNLCKGQILNDFIEAQKKVGVHYQQVVYVGDGRNDFCPMLWLGTNDIACARQGYSCEKMIIVNQQGMPLDEEEIHYHIKANIFIWKTGLDILKRIQINQC